MARHRTVVQITLLVVKTAGIVFVCAVLAWLLYPVARGTYWWSALLVGAVSFFLLLVFQAVPSALAAQTPEGTLRLIIAPLRLFHVALTPITALYQGLSRLTVAVVWRKRMAVVSRATGEEEVVEAIVEEIGEEGGALEEQEREMIRRIIDLEYTSVREIMIPRIDVVAADADAPTETVVDLVVQHGFSRIPIYEETIDNIVGVVYAKDLLRASRSGVGAPTLRSLARPPYFIPESKKVDDLLKEFQEQRTHVAVVVDEYGGTAGLVSLEDLLEEIVGEIEDEYDRQEKAIDRVNAHEAVLDARVSISDLNDLFGIEIAPEDFDTVGGLVYAQLGKIPNVGDEVSVDGLTISVLSTLGRRIKKVRAVHHLPPGPSPEQDH